MKIDFFGLSLDLIMVKKKDKVALVEKTETAQLVATLFYDYHNEEGLLNINDPIAKRVAKILEKNGQIQKADKQNEFSAYPKYIIKI